MVLVAGINPDAETGGIVSVVAIVQANRPEVLNTALSVRSKKVFMTDTSCFQSNELFRGTKNRAETCATDLH